jgi:predicted secreted protein
MIRWTSYCSFVLAIVFLTAPCLAATPGLTEFEKSLATWKTLKAKCGGNYSYKIRWSSWVGFGNETEIICQNNKVTERKYREWKGGPALVRPGAPAKPKDNSWTEKGAQIGSSKKGAPPKTLDQLYLEARKVLKTKLPPHQKLYVSYDKQGLLKSCFSVDTRIADDAPRKGVMISSIALGKAGGGIAKPSKGKTINLTTSDNGKMIKASVGDIVLIQLKANPSTGFLWSSVAQAKSSPVEFKSRKYVSDAKRKPQPGKGGQTTFTHRVTGAGKATITLNYRRPWEKKSKPAKTFTVTIEASGKAPVKPPVIVAGGDPKTVAGAWLEGLGAKGLVLVEKAPAPGFVGQKIIGRKSTMFVLSKPGWYMSLGFSGPITPNTSLAKLKQSFKYIALNQLPTPGLSIPGWKIRPQTPRSSFSDGVEFLSYTKGKIKLRVKTKFFALYGRDTRVLLPADAPSPKGTYFQIRKPFNLDLTIEAPMSMKK